MSCKEMLIAIFFFFGDLVFFFKIYSVDKENTILKA